MSDDPRVGALLGGKYRVKRCIGQGGMGAVYEAENVDFGKRVAVKIIAPDAAASREMAERFRREARAASAVESDHIVHVFDVGEDAALGLYMVMELLSGEDLASRLAREGKLAPEVATTVGAQTARALAQAHAAGVVHRDLKPANLFLTVRADGALHVKILDFGISKLRRAESSEGGPVKASTLTQVGTLLGTPQYMSPEQAQGLPVDARSDVWSLGAVLYEALAGRPAFAETRTHEQMIIQIVTKKPAPLAEVAPWVSPALRSVVHAALTLDLDARLPSAERFAEALAAAVATPGAVFLAGVSPGAGSHAAPAPAVTAAAAAKPTIRATVVDAPPRSPATRPVVITLVVGVAVAVFALVKGSGPGHEGGAGTPSNSPVAGASALVASALTTATAAPSAAAPPPDAGGAEPTVTPAPTPAASSAAPPATPRTPPSGRPAVAPPAPPPRPPANTGVGHVKVYE